LRHKWIVLVACGIVAILLFVAAGNLFSARLCHAEDMFKLQEVV
jgi:hypothetical protein